MMIVLTQGRRTYHYTVESVEYADGELSFSRGDHLGNRLFTLQPGDYARVYDYGQCLSDFKR